MKSNLNERKFFLHKIFKTDSDLIQNTKKPSVKLDHKVAKIKKSKENKSRKYDYDSIKKSLVKNLWYYVLEQINLMLNLPKIISSNSNNFKSFKTKEKDKENFNLKVLDLLQKYLGIVEEDLKKQIKNFYKNYIPMVINKTIPQSLLIPEIPVPEIKAYSPNPTQKSRKQGRFRPRI